MSDDSRHQAAPDRDGRDQTPDRELNIKAILGTGLALLVATLLGMAISWWLSEGLRGYLESEDPPPPALIEAQMPYEPPGPKLQIDPTAQLAAARAEEAAILETYAWTDDSQTLARVPIERGMELLLETRSGAEAFDEGLSPQESHGEADSGIALPSAAAVEEGQGG